MSRQFALAQIFSSIASSIDSSICTHEHPLTCTHSLTHFRVSRLAWVGLAGKEAYQIEWKREKRESEEKEVKNIYKGKTREENPPWACCDPEVK